MKIVADENIPLVHEFFDDLGDITCLPGRKMTPSDVATAEALLVRSVTRVDQTLLNSSPVKFVGTCTIGVDHLDQSYLQSTHRNYTNAPGCNANSVVEYVYAALCELDVDWQNKKVGIIGCGNVGGLLYKRLKAQGVECRCYDPLKTREQIPDLSSLSDVLSCDVISMHTPLTQSGEFPSFHLINLSQLNSLKSNAVLINAGRGPVINNSDLLNFLTLRKDVRVVLDVWEPEPNISLDLLDKVVLGSPHIAGYSYDGKLNGTEMIYQALCEYFHLPIQKHLSDLVPPLANNQLTLDESLDDWSQIKNLVRQVYSIAADDRRLREQAQLARAGQVNFGEAFDNLRKHYPKRREFHNYQVRLSAQKKPLAERLKLLGFQVEII